MHQYFRSRVSKHVQMKHPKRMQYVVDLRLPDADSDQRYSNNQANTYSKLAETIQRMVPAKRKRSHTQDTSVSEVLQTESMLDIKQPRSGEQNSI